MEEKVMSLEAQAEAAQMVSVGVGVLGLVAR